MIRGLRRALKQAEGLVVAGLALAVSLSIATVIVGAVTERSSIAWAQRQSAETAIEIERSFQALFLSMMSNRATPLAFPIAQVIGANAALREQLDRLLRTEDGNFLEARPEMRGALVDLRTFLAEADARLARTQSPQELDNLMLRLAGFRPTITGLVETAFSDPGDAVRGTQFLISYHAMFGGAAALAVSGILLVGFSLKGLSRVKRANEALVVAERMKSLNRAAGGMAHDFNNVLLAIRGGVESLRPVLRKSDPRAAQHLAGLTAAIDQGTEIAEQILRFARAMPLRVAPASIAEIAGDIEKLVAASIPPGIELSVQAEGVCGASVDRTEIGRAIMNLVVNAKEALTAHRGFGTIDVRIQTVELPPGTFTDDEEVLIHLDDGGCQFYSGHIEGKVVWISVADDGPGIPTNALKMLFEPFFTTKTNGTGFGLASCHGVVRHHGGVLSVTSRPGHGSVFEIFLPWIDIQDAPGAEPPARADYRPAAFGDGRAVMVVDDDTRAGTAVARMLELLGFEAIQVASMGEALKFLHGAPDGLIQLIVTDFQMPNGTGLDLAREIRARNLGPLPMVLLSGFLNECVQREAHALDMVTAAKPIDPARLTTVVREALKAYEPTA